MSTNRRVHWLRVVGEGAVIIASILLAFGIDAWWDKRQERSEETRILQDLHAEFLENKIRLADYVTIHEEIQEAARRISTPDVDWRQLSPEEAQNAVFRVFLGYTTFHPKSGVLNGVLSSGKLDLVTDDDLRSHLAGWPTAVLELSEQDALVIEWLTLNNPVFVQYLSYGDGLRSLFDRESNPLDDAAIQFLESPRGRSYAATREFHEGSLLQDARSLAEIIEEVLKSLEGASVSND